MGNIKDFIPKYYSDMGCTCAESVLHAANDAWNLEMSEDAFRLIGGFCGGMCTGKICGAISGGIAALSYKYLRGNAHQSPLMTEKVTELIQEAEQRLISLDCEVLRDAYVKPKIGCIDTVNMIADIIQEVYERESDTPLHAPDFRIETGIFDALPELIKEEYDELTKNEGAKTLDCMELSTHAAEKDFADMIRKECEKSGIESQDTLILTDSDYKQYRCIWKVLQDQGYTHLFYYHK
ncbi:MAG: C-GCAxxG-C-C family protein [Lachnospiraceae bacterium]|nr:C-GCAxxG-C-C family protein [Lachnospiraceae bacterium]